MSTIVLFALLAVIISIVRSVMKPGLGDKPGARKPLPWGGTNQQRKPSSANASATTAASASAERPNATRDALRSNPPPDAQRRAMEAREADKRRATETRNAAARDAARRETAARTQGQDWYIVLDVPRDAPRAEILSAVKLRIERARHAGDTQAIPRILRAAETGMGSMGTKGLRELARKLGAGS